MIKFTIIFIYLFLNSLTSFSATLQNCGNSTLDQYATDAVGRIDFDSNVSTSLSACQLVFNSPTPSGYHSVCTGQDNGGTTKIDATRSTDAYAMFQQTGLTPTNSQHFYYNCYAVPVQSQKVIPR